MDPAITLFASTPQTNANSPLSPDCQVWHLVSDHLLSNESIAQRRKAPFNHRQLFVMAVMRAAANTGGLGKLVLAGGA